MLKLVFTGVGGQGIITAGIILAEAAVLAEGRFATQSQSYGAEARGGLTRTDVILSDSEVLYPKIRQAHILAALHQRGYLSHGMCLRPGGLLICDETISVGDKTDARTILLPMRENGRGANITLLGVVCSLTGAVKPQSIREVLKHRYGNASDNFRAFETGLALAEGPELSQFRTGAVG